MSPQEKGAVAIVIIASVFVGMGAGFFAGYYFRDSQPPSLDLVNNLNAQGVSDGIWMMANRPCGYPNLTYGDQYSNMCCITEDTWYAVNGNKWVRMGLP
jgi:hypothetical protein